MTAVHTKCSKNCNLQTHNSSRGTKIRLATLLLSLLVCSSSIAEILDRTTQFIRIRLGEPNGTSEVVYNAGIPTSMGGLAGVTAAPQTTSTNSIVGGSGVFTVRVVTDLNARSGLTRLEGRFSYDSSQPLICDTPASCGTTQILFNNISWTTRDADTHTTVTEYSNGADQETWVQRDTDPANNATGTRHRNYFQYQYNNAVLLPAGEYVGTITLSGEGRF